MKQRTRGADLHSVGEAADIVNNMKDEHDESAPAAGPTFDPTSSATTSSLLDEDQASTSPTDA